MKTAKEVIGTARRQTAPLTNFPTSGRNWMGFKGQLCRTSAIAALSALRWGPPSKLQISTTCARGQCALKSDSLKMKTIAETSAYMVHLPVAMYPGSVHTVFPNIQCEFTLERIKSARSGN